MVLFRGDDIIKSYIKPFIKSLHLTFCNGRYYFAEKLKIATKLTAANKQNLYHSKHSVDNIKITFYAAVRKKGNSYCRLDLFFNSLIANSRDLSRIEVLLAIDPDDYLDYFIQLKGKYDNYFHLKIMVTNERYGYQQLHKYDKILFAHHAPNSRMFFDFSDDCFITLKNFDELLLTIDAKYSDNIYFIHTRNSEREKYLGEVTENLALLYWIMQVREPASYFPIFSRKVLDVAKEYAKLHDKHNEWSPIANSWICDCYIDILSVYIKRLGFNRIHSYDMVNMKDHQVASPTYDANKFTPNNLAFVKMLNNHTLKYLTQLAQAITQHADKSE